MEHCKTSRQPYCNSKSLNTAQWNKMTKVILSRGKTDEGIDLHEKQKDTAVRYLLELKLHGYGSSRCKKCEYRGIPH